MGQIIGIMRSKDGVSFERVCVVHLSDDSAWPATLPPEIIDLLHELATHPIWLPTNKLAADGYHYRLVPAHER